MRASGPSRRSCEH